MRSLISGRNGFLFILVVSLAFNAGFGTTFGVRTYQRQRCGGGHGGRAGFGNLHEKLNLTAEQEVQMEAAKEKLLGQIDRLREELGVETAALAELVIAPHADRTAIALQLDRAASLRKQIQGQVVEHFLEVKDLLRPDQCEAFDEIIHRHIFQHGEGGHHRRPCDGSLH